MLVPSSPRTVRVSVSPNTSITADSGFPMMLALRSSRQPSVVLLRHVGELPPPAHGALLVDNLATVANDLYQGAVVSLSPTRLAVRSLPIK